MGCGKVIPTVIQLNVSLNPIFLPQLYFLDILRNSLELEGAMNIDKVKFEIFGMKEL